MNYSPPFPRSHASHFAHIFLPGCPLGVVCGGPYEGHPTPGPSVDEHLAVFKAQVRAAQAFNPVRINSHTGNDSMTREEGRDLFSQVRMR